VPNIPAEFCIDALRAWISSVARCLNEREATLHIGIPRIESKFDRQKGAPSKLKKLDKFLLADCYALFATKGGSMERRVSIYLDSFIKLHSGESGEKLLDFESTDMWKLQ
jgi:hypothetical protein